MDRLSLELRLKSLFKYMRSEAACLSKQVMLTCVSIT